MYGNHMKRRAECVSAWVLRKEKKSEKVKHLKNLKNHPETPSTPQENSTIYEETPTIDSKALMDEILKCAKHALDMSFDKRFGPMVMEPLEIKNKSEEKVDESGSFEDVKAWALSQKKKHTQK